MNKFKENPKYHVVSLRVSDDEKAFLDEISLRDRTSISSLMREAIRSYIPHLISLKVQR